MKTLKELVIEEAIKLREHATEEERGRLNIKYLSADSASLCIYGQMTGSCWSPRAEELLNLCAKPFCDVVYLRGTIKKRLSGGPFIRAFSPIEAFIYYSSKKTNADLVSYIKGERETLTIEDL